MEVVADEPHHDRRYMRDLFIRQNLSRRDIADRLDITPRTVSRWLDRFGLKEPWQDRETMRKMYIDEGLTQEEISNRFNCRATTISKWLRRHDIETENGQDFIYKAAEARRVNRATFYTEKRGYEIWDCRDGYDSDEVYVHRLLAVAEYGLAAVKNKQIHHKNGVPWDNRHENVEPLSNSDHQKLHGRRNLWADD